MLCHHSVSHFPLMDTQAAYSLKWGCAVAARKLWNHSALTQQESISCSCPRAVWLGTFWMVISKQGLRNWAVPTEGKRGRGDRAVGFMATHHFFLRYTSWNPVTWTQPRCEGVWETRSSLCVSLPRFFFFVIMNNNSINIFFHFSLGYGTLISIR